MAKNTDDKDPKKSKIDPAVSGDGKAMMASLFPTSPTGTQILAPQNSILALFASNKDDVCKMVPTTQRAPAMNQATVQAAPDPSFSDAFYRAQFGSTPLHKLDIFMATVRDVSLMKIRGALFSERVDKALTDVPAGVIKPIAYAMSGDWNRPGDRQFSEGLAHKVGKYWDGSQSKPQKFGDYDVTMAVGWHPKDPIKVNGVMTKLDKPIDNLLAAFVRNPDGSVEILDPSIKARSMGEAARKLPLMGYTLNDSYADRKWAQTAGSYIAWQIMPIAISGGLGAGVKALGTATKSEQVLALTEKMNMASKLGSHAGLAQLGAVGANIAGTLYQKSLSDDTVDKMVKSLVSSLKDPSKISATNIVDSLNKGLHDYTFNKDLSKSIYVPSLAVGTSPWSRLGQVLSGRVDGFIRPQSPWDDWKRERTIQLPEITNKLASSPELMSGYYGVIGKALANKPLNDQEVLLARVGTAVNYRATWQIEGKNFDKGTLSYTDEERQKTVSYTRAVLKQNLLDDIQNHPAIAKALGVDLKKLTQKGKEAEEAAAAYSLTLQADLPAKIDDKILGMYVTEMKAKADQQVAEAARKQLEQDRLRAQGMALALTPH